MRLFARAANAVAARRRHVGVDETRPTRADVEALRARLLDPVRLARYDGLALHVRRGMGDRPGERRVPGRPQPSGIELEAHSAYAPGDDLRHLDWNALGRLDTLLVRRFTAEREVVAHVLLDASASLGVPVVDDKLGTACEIAMALAYIALSAGDAVRLRVLAGDDDAGPARGAAEREATRVLRSRANVRRVAERLAAVVPAGTVALGAAIEAEVARHPTPGLALLVSDCLLAPADAGRALEALRARRYETHLVHVVGAAELDPTRQFSRGVVIDVESRATRPIALTPATVARYQAVFAAHVDALRALADRHGASYSQLVAGSDVAVFVMTALARAGLVRRR